MKKTLAIVCGLLTASIAMAAEQPTTLTKEQIEAAPKMNFGVFDTSSKVPSKLATNIYSVSKSKDLQVCWAAFDMPLQENNQAVEVFNTPAASKFVEKNGLVTSSSDNKQHTVTTQVKRTNNEFVTKCWSFDNTDPLGKYTIDVKVNNIVFPDRKSVV